MSFTVSQVITQVQRRLPDVQAAELLVLVNQVHRDILSQAPELRRDRLTVNLTAGVGEYTLSEQVFQVDDAEYLSGAGPTQALKLLGTSVETLDQTAPTWRSDAASTPSQFYLSSSQLSGNTEVVGIYPSPSLSTSGGYPVLALYGSFLQSSDLATTDSCLVTLHSSQVYVEGVAYLAALEARPTMAGAYWAQYQRELDAAMRYARTRNEDMKSPFSKNSRGAGYQEAPPKRGGR